MTQQTGNKKTEKNTSLTPIQNQIGEAVRDGASKKNNQKKNVLSVEFLDDVIGLTPNTIVVYNLGYIILFILISRCINFLGKAMYPNFFNKPIIGKTPSDVLSKKVGDFFIRKTKLEKLYNKIKVLNHKRSKFYEVYPERTLSQMIFKKYGLGYEETKKFWLNVLIILVPGIILNNVTAGYLFYRSPLSGLINFYYLNILVFFFLFGFILILLGSLIFYDLNFRTYISPDKRMSYYFRIVVSHLDFVRFYMFF